MNKHMSLSWIIYDNALVISGKVYVAWKRKMLHDVSLHYVIGGHQAYILHLAKTTRGSRDACALRARRNYKVALLARNNYSLRSRWIVANIWRRSRYYLGRLKIIIVLVYTHELISTESERESLAFVWRVNSMSEHASRKQEEIRKS